MSNKVIELHWYSKNLEADCGKVDYPKSLWQESGGKPFGIYFDIDEYTYGCQWYATENERDNALHKELKQ